jgi:hypothetical protein
MANSIRDVLDRDQRGEYDDWSKFDGSLWLALCEFYPTDEALDHAPEPIRVYYATRLLQWDVGNGGFAQAAMNYPGIFEFAAHGYEVLGKPGLAAFIREAAVLGERERENIDEARASLEEAFAYFDEGIFERFDEQLEQIGWFDNDEMRLDYVRANRQTFIEAGETRR